MAVETKKVKERLKAFIATQTGLNLSNTRIDELSARLAQKPADDADDAAIDLIINEANFYQPFTELAKLDDTMRTLKANQKTPPPAPDPVQDPEPDTNDLAKLIAAAVSQAITPISEKLNALESDKKVTSIKEKAKTLLTEVPELYWKRAPLPEKEEDLDNWANEIKTDYTALVTTTNNANLGTGGVLRGTPVLAGNSKAVEKEMEEYLKTKTEIKQNP